VTASRRRAAGPLVASLALAAAAASAGGAAGCGGGGGGGGSAAQSGPKLFYRDVQPILQQHCQGCHNPQGFAPFSLVTYDDAKSYATVMAGTTANRIMPPWPPRAGCGDFQDPRVLTDDQIAAIGAWASAGAPAGNPKDAPPVVAPAGANLGPPSLTLDPGGDYHADATLTDDYRCFLVDPALTSQKDLIGFDIHPGAPNSVHHVLLFSIPASSVAAAKAMDAAGAGLGWSCFGASGVSGAQTIGGWVPGAGAAPFPPSTGIPLQPGIGIVMQIHYNLAVQKDVTDRTTADLFFAATPVDKPALIVPLTNTSFVIPAGTKSQTVTAETTIPTNTAAVLWGVVPHMHLHGTEIKVEIFHTDGSSDCAIDIPTWNFHWQQFYYYQQPLLGLPGDAVRLSCTYDNSAEDQPVFNGVKLAPADLHWGEKTTDEMCLSYFYLTAP
jgi:mono/diheme cytochrome c family protein